jgi:hypothetical protein
MPAAWLPAQDDRRRAQDEMRTRSRLDSGQLLAEPAIGASIGGGYRTHWATAFQTRGNPPSDWSAPDWRASLPSQEDLMTKLSKTLIAATAFAAIATTAFSQAPMEFKSGMAHVYAGGKMSGITIAPSEKNHEAMMKHATKVPNNTVFFMNNGQLYSTSGMLDPTGNFYLP